MKRKTIGITLILSILLALMTAGTAFASENNEIEVEGLITAIYPIEFKFEILVDNVGVLEIYTVQVGQAFDFEGIELEDLIEVKGILDEEGIIHLTGLKIQEKEKEQEQEQKGELESYFCTNETSFHPLGVKLNATYGVEYSDIEEYLCGENPIPMGHIKLAVQTAALTDGDFTEYMDGFEGISWGKIWQELELNGKPSKGIPFGQIKKEFKDGAEEENIPPGQLKKSGEFTPKGQLKKNK